MPPQPGSSSSGSSSITLGDDVVRRFKPAKIFQKAVEVGPAPAPTGPQRPSHQGPKQITGICFDDKGEFLITAAEDETFRTYNCKTGKPLRTLYSKKYGVDLPRFTHKSSAIVYASTKEDDTIRYHSLHDNKYLQYFRGHKARVISLEVSPVDDGFMSGSLDKTVRLWDLRSPTCRGLLSLPEPPVIAYDSSGMVFAVGVNHYSRIMLYDQAHFDKAPFLTIELEDMYLAQTSFPPRPIFMTSLSFSSNGKYILVGCSGNAHYIIDSFEGLVLARLEGHIGLERRSLNAPPDIEPARGISGEEVSWTPDSKYVIGGSLDGKVFVWSIQPLESDPPPPGGAKPLLKRIHPISNLEGQPTAPTRCVRFNPRLGMLATAGPELAFWLPDTSGDPEETAKNILLKKKNAS
ncbi:WD40 repeat-like protein [Coprinopsis marcescibilis]|uniref:WD40 repeat-like protein n=1 Tax=Coprinopsis marcescibilis TaxID=230819 RepID=A0A5C3L3A0_COPMA|nr:WD40 repeat-like protein [Coprinopsis marcescibilis]